MKFKPSDFEKSLEKTYQERVQKVHDALNTDDSVEMLAEAHTAFYKASGVEISLPIAKGIRAILTTLKDQCVREALEAKAVEVDEIPQFEGTLQQLDTLTIIRKP